MDKYFDIVLKGYLSETTLEDSILQQLLLFIQSCLMENIIDAFDVMRREDEIKCDEELSYKIKCLDDSIPYIGFFHEMYSAQKPFQCEPRDF